MYFEKCDLTVHSFLSGKSYLPYLSIDCPCRQMVALSGGEAPLPSTRSEPHHLMTQVDELTLLYYRTMSCFRTCHGGKTRHRVSYSERFYVHSHLFFSSRQMSCMPAKLGACTALDKTKCDIYIHEYDGQPFRFGGVLFYIIRSSSLSSGSSSSKYVLRLMVTFNFFSICELTCRRPKGHVKDSKVRGYVAITEGKDSHEHNPYNHCRQHQHLYVSLTTANCALT